jgi:hypothetical protein
MERGPRLRAMFCLAICSLKSDTWNLSCPFDETESFDPALSLT